MTKLRIEVDWVQEHQAIVSIRTEGNVKLADAVGAMGTVLRMLVGADGQRATQPQRGDAILPPQMKAPTYRPAKVS